MNSAFSVYLDLVRILAASFVVYAHSNVRWLIADPLPLAQHAHSAVTVFFVLSGFVISFISERRESTAADYVASRTSRILSLSVLAVLLTPLLDMVSRPVHASFFAAAVPNDYWPVRVGASLAFLAEIWTLSIMTFSNVPYWSLNYEVWYYALFGVYTFAAGKARNVLLAAICLLIGPKILLMLPVWLLGVAAYRWRPDERWSVGMALLLWVASVAAFGLYHYFDLMRGFSDLVLQYGGKWLHVHLAFSQYFAADWLLGAIVMVNFMAARKLTANLGQVPKQISKFIGSFGGLTFALYIFHFPLLYFWGAIVGLRPPGWSFYAIVVALAATSAMGLGLFGERLRPWIRQAVTQVMRKYTKPAPTQPAVSA